MTDGPAPHHAADAIPEAAFSAADLALALFVGKQDWRRNAAGAALTAAWPHLVAALAAAPPPPASGNAIALTGCTCAKTWTYQGHEVINAPRSDCPQHGTAGSQDSTPLPKETQ